jgi:hypothetical protein
LDGKYEKKEFYEEVEVVGAFLYMISIKLSFQPAAGFSKKAEQKLKINYIQGKE